MSDDPKAVHVSQTGENWEVESDAGTLAQAETKQEAIEAAQEVAREVQASEIVVHTQDGRVEAHLSVKSALSGEGEAAGEREP